MLNNLNIKQIQTQNQYTLIEQSILPVQIHSISSAEANFLPLIYSEFTTSCSNSMHYSQNYSQDHCQNNPEALKLILYCKT